MTHGEKKRQKKVRVSGLFSMRIFLSVCPASGTVSRSARLRALLCTALFPVAAGSHLYAVFKCICKFPLGFIPYFCGDYGNTFIGFFQQFHCLLYPVFFHIGGNGQTVDFLEGLL